MSGRLDGRIALITGATRGIGAAVAKIFAAEGSHVILTGRTVGGLEEVDDAIRTAGGAATLVPFDLTDFTKIDELGHAIFKRWGKLDILVGNAATLGRIGPMGHMEPEKFEKVIALNVTANWRLIRSLDVLLRQSDAGRALFVTCQGGHEPAAYGSAYAASKAALEMMVNTWDKELRLTKLRALLIDPGPVGTGLRRDVFPGEDQAGIPTPEDVAPMFVDAVLRVEN